MKLKIIYIIAALIFLSAVIGTIILSQKPRTDIVEIVRDGEVLYSFDLSVTKDRTFTVEYGGSYNVIEIKDGTIRVSDAGCKDHTCVKMGCLKGAAPIVCLPNHLVIRFADSEDIDAVVR